MVGSAHNSIIVWGSNIISIDATGSGTDDYKIRLGVTDSIPIGIECVVVLTGLTNPKQSLFQEFQNL